MLVTMFYHADGQIKFDDVSSEKIDTQVSPVPQLFIIRKLNEKWNACTGIFAPFGLPTEY